MVIPDASTLGAAGVAGAMDAIAWAAAAANVSSLVIGRWPADGFSRDAFLSLLHAQLAKGVPIGQAWRAATVSARETAGAAPRMGRPAADGRRPDEVSFAIGVPGRYC